MTAPTPSPEAVPLAAERLGITMMQAVVDSDWLAEHDERVRTTERERIATAMTEAVADRLMYEDTHWINTEDAARIARNPEEPTTLAEQERTS